jgi:diguanylate cyclase (GGDEF)-like protein
VRLRRTVATSAPVVAPQPVVAQAAVVRTISAPAAPSRPARHAPTPPAARELRGGGGSLHLPRLRDLLLPNARLASVVIPRAVWLALGALALLAALLGTALAIYARRLREASAHAEALAGLASTDPLTGLLNRRAIEDRLTVEVARARRYGGNLAVVYCDLRALKTINDRYGHDIGDRALRTVAGVLRGQIREGDAGARVGGDEYAVTLVNQDRSGASAFCDRVHRRLATTRAPTGDIPLDLTMGVAVFPEDGDTAADLLTSADRNLYAQRGISVGS